MERVDYIKEQLLLGKTFKEVGSVLGISRQRVEAIFKKHFDIALQDRGVSRKVILRKEKRKQEVIATLGRDTYFCEDDLSRRRSIAFSRKRQNARQTGYDWDLTLADIDWPDTCPVLGIPINYFAETREEASPSFDRVDSSKGYVKGNVKILSWRANRIKNDGTLDDHLKIVAYLSQH